jgi:uncharacterized protein
MDSKPEDDGRWALVTGASSGIGKALAFELAAHGFNLYLTARDSQILGAVAADCAGRFGIRTHTHSADLASEAEVEELVATLAAAPRFEFLANNAGFALRGPFLATRLDREVAMLRVQLAAMLKLTRAVLPGMVDRRSGHILNVASVYSFSPVPNQAVYGACKAFLLSFSVALREELKDSGVTVTALCPGVTQTEFRTRAGIPEKNAARGATAAHVARIAVRRSLQGDAVVIPGVANRLFVFLVRHVPASFLPLLIRLINDWRGVNAQNRS